MVLEVIVENAPAIALYEKLGFARTRQLEVLSLAAANPHTEARETDLGEGLNVVAATRDGPEPWQRADETIANLSRRGSPPRAVTVDGAAAVSVRTVTASACSRREATPPASRRSPPHYARGATSRR
jgi:hypothetical protein